MDGFAILSPRCGKLSINMAVSCSRLRHAYIASYCCTALCTVKRMGGGRGNWIKERIKGKKIRKIEPYMVDWTANVYSIVAHTRQRPTFCGTRYECDASGDATVIEFVWRFDILHFDTSWCDSWVPAFRRIIRRRLFYGDGNNVGLMADEVEEIWKQSFLA